MTTIPDDDDLATWVSLNAAIVSATEERCIHLMALEKSRKHRVQFMLRIHSRLNKLRADRERRAIKQAAKGGV